MVCRLNQTIEEDDNNSTWKKGDVIVCMDNPSSIIIAKGRQGQNNYSIAKALRTKVTKGKSPIFMGFILLGYIFGIINKFVNHQVDYVIWFYVLNFCLVAFDLILYFKYKDND